MNLNVIGYYFTNGFPGFLVKETDIITITNRLIYARRLNLKEPVCDQ